MRKDIYKKTFPLSSSEAESNQLGLFQLLGYLENVAVDHAELMGIGYDNMIRTQTFWVLTRQKLMMKMWPTEGNIEVQTWSRPLKGISATRDFEIFFNNEKIGDCSTRWMVLDAANRRPTRPTVDHEKAITRSDYELNYDAEKVEMQADAATVRQLKVQPSDLDVNNHVNNTKYGQWLTNTVNNRKEYSRHLKSYEINFMAETHLGDDVLIQSKEISEQPATTFFQGRRESDQQILFAATLQSSI